MKFRVWIAAVICAAVAITAFGLYVIETNERTKFWVEITPNPAHPGENFTVLPYVANGERCAMGISHSLIL